MLPFRGGRHRRAKDQKFQPASTDDSQARLDRARAGRAESARLLSQTDIAGRVVSRHVAEQRRIRVENGFVATILDSLQGR